ncbi:MAG: cobalamin B12-binding domain-containing protein [Candidatus Freyarchaeota archaeon]|mgnify:CR=1 FL=1
MDLLAAIRDCIVNFDEDRIEEYVGEALKSGIPPREIIEKGVKAGAQIVGEKFERGEYFLPELVMAGEVIKKGVAVLEKAVAEEGEEAKEVVVVATVQGDIHDIGKDLVAAMLKGNGFKVVDLGVDVPPEKVVEAVKEHGAKVVCLSMLITPALEGLTATVEALKEAGLRDRVKIVIGGAATSPEMVERYGVDYYGHDANEAVEICKQII